MISDTSRGVRPTLALTGPDFSSSSVRVADTCATDPRRWCEEDRVRLGVLRRLARLSLGVADPEAEGGLSGYQVGALDTLLDVVDDVIGAYSGW
jgi:hypothetical protein